MNPPTVLILDPDEAFRRNLLVSLHEVGCRVLTATSGREALDRLQVEKPNFLLFDPSVPGLNALDFLQTLHANPPAPALLIFVLSEDANLETKVACLEAGAHEYLQKPVSGREVAARIHRFARLTEDLRQQLRPASPPVEKRYIVPSKDTSHGSVDLLGSASDSFARIRPSYGIYRVENLIGSGGMGYVFKAYEEPLDRFVAVKILSRKLSSTAEFVQRFRHEAKVLASLNHPGIAFIYSFGEEDGEHYFAMQWCPGGSLNDLIRKKGRLELVPSVDILLQCARALEAASHKGIVHRDIKPTNLLFDENQQIKIVDFGLASAEKLAAHLTQAHEFIGTPTFMAPEQAQSSAVDHRADIYALGITFYYMLYGRYPYEAASSIEMLIKHASEPFPPYDSLHGRIPQGAYDIIRRMVQKQPEDRYQDYPSLIHDLERLRNNLLSESQWKIPRLERSAGAAPIHSTNLFELLSSICAQSASGALTVRWSSLKKRFLLRQHEVVLFESTQPDENIWNELVRRKLLKPEQVPPREEDLEKSLNRFLLNEVFSMEEFRTAYRQLMKDALAQVFFWPELQAEFQNAAVEHDAFASVRLGDLLLETARTLLPLDVVRSRVEPGNTFHRTPQFELVLSSLNLRPEESFAAYRIEGNETTLTTLHLLTGLPEERLARFVFALESMGAILSRAPEEKRPGKKAEAAALSSPTPSSEVFAPPPTPAAPVRQPAPGSERTPPPGSMSDSSVVRMELQKSERKIEVEHHVKVADQFFRLAQEKFAELDYWKVTELCKQAIRHQPADSRYYHLMALAYAHHPRFAKDAEQCFYKAIEVDPWNPDYHIDLAKFYMNQGLPSRALAQCEKALRIAPEHILAKELLSEIHTRK